MSLSDFALVVSTEAASPYASGNRDCSNFVEYPMTGLCKPVIPVHRVVHELPGKPGARDLLHGLLHLTRRAKFLNSSEFSSTGAGDELNLNSSKEQSPGPTTHAQNFYRFPATYHSRP